MNIAFLIFNGLTALDLFGPLDILSRMKGSKVQLVSCYPGPIDIGNNVFINTDLILNEDSRFDIIVVPGGLGQIEFCNDQKNLKILKMACDNANYILSVCTGALILGMCGLLKNKKAVTHWLAMDALESLGAIPTKNRIVEDGNIITCSGVSAGLDMALYVISKFNGHDEAKKIQLLIEYDPDPPYLYKTLKEDKLLLKVIEKEKRATNSKRDLQIVNFLNKKITDG